MYRLKKIERRHEQSKKENLTCTYRRVVDSLLFKTVY